MNCCHADFALVEGSDRGFTVGMPTFTFGTGVLREAGPQAQDLGLKRVALFTDKNMTASEPSRSSAPRSPRRTSIPSYSMRFRSTNRRFVPVAAQFARDANADGYVSVGGGSVMTPARPRISAPTLPTS
jgi:alcohol dehydrogenase class IV